MNIPLRSGTRDAEYLAKLEEGLVKAYTDFPGAQLVIYNAGTDVLESDPLGRLGVSAKVDLLEFDFLESVGMLTRINFYLIFKGILRRDQLVFEHCRHHNVPVVMVTSGGYTSQSAKVGILNNYFS